MVRVALPTRGSTGYNCAALTLDNAPTLSIHHDLFYKRLRNLQKAV
jgi:hypothetical protein